jgi:hypothetical protein
MKRVPLPAIPYFRNKGKIVFPRKAKLREFSTKPTVQKCLGKFYTRSKKMIITITTTHKIHIRPKHMLPIRNSLCQ